MDYQEFLKAKQKMIVDSGFESEKGKRTYNGY